MNLALRRSQWLRLVLTLSVLAFVACGDSDDGGTGNTSGPTTISGRVFKSAVDGATVTVHTIDPDGSVGPTVAGPVTTNASGDFSVEAPANKNGDYLICATGGTYTNEATSQSENVGSSILTGYLSTNSSSGFTMLTPWTEAMYQAVLDAVAGGANVGDAWDDIIADLQSGFGFNPLTQEPGMGTEAAENYYAVLGGLMNLLENDVILSQLDGTNTEGALALALDAMDGLMDGLFFGQTIPIGTGNLPAVSDQDLQALIDQSNNFAQDNGLTNADVGDLMVGDGGNGGNGELDGLVMVTGDANAPMEFVPQAYVGVSIIWSFIAMEGNYILSATEFPKQGFTDVFLQYGQDYNWRTTTKIGNIPGVSSDGNTITFNNVQLQDYDVPSGAKKATVTLNGSLTRPDQ